MKRSTLGRVPTVTLVMLAVVTMACGGPKKPAEQVREESAPKAETAPVPEPLPSDPNERLDGSSGPAGKGTTTPVSQVGFELSATGHPTGCTVTMNCNAILGLRQKDAGGTILDEQHYEYLYGQPDLANAGKGVAQVPGIAWTRDEIGIGSLTLTCSSCTAVDLNNARTIANVQLVGTNYDGVNKRTIVTLGDKNDASSSLALAFPGNLSPEAKAWVDALTSSAGVSLGTVTVPKSSPTVTYTFALGPACTVPWTWRDLPTAQ